MLPPHVPPIHCHGDVLAGRYRLLRPLGEGGMGSVWSARSLEGDVDVAVKLVKRSVSTPHACERLLREARAAASLDHPSIVRVLDFGTTDDGEPFLVMQLLHGKTLGGWLRERGRVPATIAVQLLLPIASALAEVHSLGIVHRDIKPENILFEEAPGGEVVPKLVDFGIAKHGNVEQSCFTLSGVLLGSPAYMSPEQARGESHIDPRSDVWSLSVVLYEMITGKRPFEANNHGAMIFAVFADTPDPTHTQGAGDEALWEILRRGLAKDRLERWQSVKQLGRALALWAAARGVTEDVTGASITCHHHPGPDSSCWNYGTEQPSTEVDHGARHTKPPDLEGQVQTTSSPFPPGEPPPSTPDAATPARSRSAGLGLGLSAALVVLTGILVTLMLAPGSGGTAAGSPAPTPPYSIEMKLPAARAAPGVPTDTVVPIAAPTTRMVATWTTRDGESPPPHRAAPVVPPRPAQIRSSMPLPAGPDF